MTEEEFTCPRCSRTKFKIVRTKEKKEPHIKCLSCPETIAIDLETIKELMDIMA